MAFEKRFQFHEDAERLEQRGYSFRARVFGRGTEKEEVTKRDGEGEGERERRGGGGGRCEAVSVLGDGDRAADNLQYFGECGDLGELVDFRERGGEQ